jgi:stalled ribosome rescue protein Dom34
MRRGRKSLAQTPSPPKERIYGSKRNVSGSASSADAARTISFSSSLQDSIKNKVKEYNAKNDAKITLATAKAIVRRGMGAYFKSHRPTITNNKPNSRTAWGLARLNAFMRKKSKSSSANGVVVAKRIKKSYKQDDDLL